ncbi:non-homologous end joining protein Ku [Paraburkholderia acidisoli]|uniref:Non-homologous end joining protein Ku n=1 Tax=Paraburkholderia acidisoli TaxID=2571748 RepID=A0A7Z2GRR6_9BURK|nr:Ku protein [Paraburkholderia acidisoli]QGZ66702.1 Ku protein [Paraburkholderia acidisoli]
MAARSLASLSLSFGLVSIPVKVFTATESHAGVSFNLLHKDCGSRLKQQYVCPQHQTVVPREDMVKGYEFEKDRYVVFEKDELEALEATAQHTVDIIAFLPASAIDPLYLDKPYYLGPDKRGGKPYWLLAKSMLETGTCALAKWVWKGSQHMVQLRATEDGIILTQLLFADEIRAMTGLDVEKPDLSASEMTLAGQLIEQYRVDAYDAAAFHDEEKERVLAAIDQKIAGKKITVAPVAQQAGAEIIDLADALRRSLQGRGKRAAPAAAKTARAAQAAQSADETPAATVAAKQRKPARRASGSTATPAAVPVKRTGTRKS